MGEPKQRIEAPANWDAEKYLATALSEMLQREPSAMNRVILDAAIKDVVTKPTREEMVLARAGIIRARIIIESGFLESDAARSYDPRDISTVLDLLNASVDLLNWENGRG